MMNVTNGKLVEILEKAQMMKKRELEFFEAYDNVFDDELKQIFWTRSEKYEGKCSGLLTAYEIITGRTVLGYKIDNEIEYQKQLQI